MQTVNERLRIARKKAGFSSLKEAAEALGVSYPTYAGHENGHDGFKIDSAVKYARRFKVSLDWLATGKGKGPSDTARDMTPIEEVQERFVSAAAEAVSLGVNAVEIADWVVDAIGSAHADIARQQVIAGLSRMLSRPEIHQEADETKRMNGGQRSEDSRKL